MGAVGGDVKNDQHRADVASDAVTKSSDTMLPIEDEKETNGTVEINKIHSVNEMNAKSDGFADIAIDGPSVRSRLYDTLRKNQNMR